jgi:uncharacterized membrane protein
LTEPLAKGLPRWATYLATCVVVVGLGFLVTDDVVVRGHIEFVNVRYRGYDAGTDPGVVAQSVPEVSGSPQSLIPWGTLGREGEPRSPVPPP